ncbi:MAG: M18 family aminopeptidase [Clostridiales bacterium]|nr:M18 family aminopeptidase [Clostridiales bacterium]
MDIMERFLTFAEQSPTAFHAAANLAEILRENGFGELKETDPWFVDAGGKYYVMRNDSALIAFEVPETGFASFRICAAHADSPAFKLKENFEDRTEAYVRLNTEKYGGMIMSSWMDRPLSVAGRLAVRDGDGVSTRLVNLDRDALLIPNMPIHFNREVNSGYAWDPQVDLLPLYGDEGAAGGLIREVAEAAGVESGEILSHDLFLYSRQSGSVWGAGDVYFSCGRIDDLECAWAAVQALVRSTARDTIHVCAVFDNEEVGSGSRQGADSGFLYDTLTRLGFALGASDGEIRAATAGSFMVSADNAHAVHPNHPEKYDKQNRVYMNKGIVIKHNANLKYTTDAISSARFALICEKAGVPVQHFANRSDIAGGSTLGHISAAHVSVDCVDIGLAQLAMHSAYETAGTRDLPMLIRALEALYS